MQGEARWMSAAKRDKNGVTKMDEECMLIFKRPSSSEGRRERRIG
jgi:hypothetical protein